MTIVLTWQRLALWCVLVALAAFAVAGWAWNPVEDTADHLVAPVAREAGILDSRCPNGWNDTTDKDIHVRVISCSKGSWVVILDAEGDFDHAFQLDTPGSTFIFTESQVPGWK